MKPLLNSKIRNAIDEQMPMFWTRRGVYGFELRAVSYIYENGRERTKKLAEFDLRDTLHSAFEVHIEICKLVSPIYAPDIVAALQNPFWDGTLGQSPQAMLDEYRRNHDLVSAGGRSAGQERISDENNIAK